MFTSTAHALSESTLKRRKLRDFETQNRENVHINLREPYRPSIPMQTKGSACKGASSETDAKAAFCSTAVAAAVAAVNPIPSNSTCIAPHTSENSNTLRRSSTASLVPKGKAFATKDPIQRRSSMSAAQTTVRPGTGMGMGMGTDREKGTGTGRKEVKCVEVVRKKSEREALPGHQCTECAAYYEALLQQGMVTETGMEEMLQKCSRHKVIGVRLHKLYRKL